MRRWDPKIQSGVKNEFGFDLITRFYAIDLEVNRFNFQCNSTAMSVLLTPRFLTFLTHHGAL